MDLLVESYKTDSKALKMSINNVNVPQPLAETYQKPCKDTAVAEYISRFAQHQ